MDLKSCKEYSFPFPTPLLATLWSSYVALITSSD